MLTSRKNSLRLVSRSESEESDVPVFTFVPKVKPKSGGTCRAPDDANTGSFLTKEEQAAREAAARLAESFEKTERENTWGGPAVGDEEADEEEADKT